MRRLGIGVRANVEFQNCTSQQSVILQDIPSFNRSPVAAITGRKNGGCRFLSIFIMEFYLIKNRHGDILIRMVHIENDWTISFMYSDNGDRRFRDCLIDAVERCGVLVQEVKNRSYTSGVNYCVIRFSGQGTDFCLDGPGEVCEVAGLFFGAELKLEEA